MNKLNFLLVLSACFMLSAQVSAQTTNKNTSKQDIIELTPSDFEPSFTKDTVIKLNAIVSRSVEIINEYDAIIGDVKSAAAKTTTEQSTALAEQEVARIDALSERSKQALSEMTSAVKTLEESDEKYNRAILAGMIDFVQDVEKEISSQTKILMMGLDKS